MNAALKMAEGTFSIAEVERPAIVDSNFVLARVRVAGICALICAIGKKAEPELECHIFGHKSAGDVVEVDADVHMSTWRPGRHRNGDGRRRLRVLPCPAV